MTKFFHPRLDRRQDFVKRTITTIKSMGLECDRTNTTGEFRISKKVPNGIIVVYAKTPESAIALAKHLKGE